MNRLLSTTAILSIVLAPMQPLPLMAQDADLNMEISVAEDGSVLAADGAVLCSVSAGQTCDLEQITQQLLEGNAEQLKADAMVAVEAAAAADASAAEAAAAEAAAAEAAAAEAAAAEAAAALEAEAAAQAAADAAAADQANVEAEAAAAAALAEEEAAAATALAEEETAAAEALAAEEAAAAEAAAATALAEEEAAAADALAAEQAAADAAAAEAEAIALAEEEAAMADALAAEEAAAADAAAEEVVTEEATTEQPATEEAATADAEPVAPIDADSSDDVLQTEADPIVAPEVDAEATAEVEGEAEVTPEAEAVAEVDTVPVDVPVVTEEENQSLINLLSAPTATEADVDGEAGNDGPDLAAAAAALGLIAGAAGGETAPAADGAAPAAQPEPESVTVTTVTEETTRSSAEEFTAAPTAVGDNQKSGLSNLEKVGLLALGALVVGKVLSDGREVVEQTGDRVVVRDPQGNFQVYKDDDTLLRRPGATVRTESYSDGSSRSIIDREDGVQVVTIRDASGRVLRRSTYDSRGNEVVLIDDLAREERIDVSTLPQPRPDRVTISTNDSDASLKAALVREEARAIGRTFSLRQIREIPQVRALAATIDVDNITFDSGSAVIRPTEARKLASLGRIMDDILQDNPGEVFLIEGHTDAVGSASYNLTLSDRRAESVALALTEYYGIPPENMVVQGYGEGELRVETQADERRNRRAVLRVVTPLMRTASLQ